MKSTRKSQINHLKQLLDHAPENNRKQEVQKQIDILFKKIYGI